MPGPCRASVEILRVNGLQVAGTKYCHWALGLLVPSKPPGDTQQGKDEFVLVGLRCGIMNW